VVVWARWLRSSVNGGWSWQGSSVRYVAIMTKGQANLIRAFSIWTVFVWGTRIKNVFSQHKGWKFEAVHVTLAAVSVLFAIGAWWVVTQNRGRNAPKLAPETTLLTAPAGDGNH
jgi:hypothetical protein